MQVNGFVSHVLHMDAFIVVMVMIYSFFVHHQVGEPLSLLLHRGGRNP